MDAMSGWWVIAGVVGAVLILVRGCSWWSGGGARSRRWPDLEDRGTCHVDGREHAINPRTGEPL